MKDRLCRWGIKEKIDRICWFSSVPPTFEPVFFPFPEPEIRPYFFPRQPPARAALFDLHDTRDPATVFSPCGAPVFSESFPQPCGKNPVEKRREMAFFLEFYTVSTEFSTVSGRKKRVFHCSKGFFKNLRFAQNRRFPAVFSSLFHEIPENILQCFSKYCIIKKPGSGLAFRSVLRGDVPEFRQASPTCF